MTHQGWLKQRASPVAPLVRVSEGAISAAVMAYGYEVKSVHDWSYGQHVFSASVVRLEQIDYRVPYTCTELTGRCGIHCILGHQGFVLFQT
jgi:hypothetical protein